MNRLSKKDKAKIIHVLKTGVELKTVADQLNMSVIGLLSCLNPPRSASVGLSDDDKRKLLDEYKNDAPIAELAERYKVSESYIYKLAKRHKAKRGGKMKHLRERLRDIKRLARQGKTRREIAEALDLNLSTVRSIIRRFNVEVKPADRSMPAEKVEYLRTMYQNKNVPVSEIAEHLGIKKTSVYRYAQRLNISRGQA